MTRMSPLALKQISNLGQCFPMFPLLPYITPNAKIEKKKIYIYIYSGSEDLDQLCEKNEISTAIREEK